MPFPGVPHSFKEASKKVLYNQALSLYIVSSDVHVVLTTICFVCSSAAPCIACVPEQTDHKSSGRFYVLAPDSPSLERHKKRAWCRLEALCAACPYQPCQLESAFSVKVRQDCRSLHKYNTPTTPDYFLGVFTVVRLVYFACVPKAVTGR